MPYYLVFIRETRDFAVGYHLFTSIIKPLWTTYLYLPTCIIYTYLPASYIPTYITHIYLPTRETHYACAFIYTGRSLEPVVMVVTKQTNWFFTTQWLPYIIQTVVKLLHPNKFCSLFSCRAKHHVSS